MLSKVSSRLAAAALLACSIASAQSASTPANAPTAEELLARTAEAYRGASSYFFVAVETTLTLASDARKETVTTVLTAKDSAGRTRVEFDDRLHDGIGVFDGDHTWVYLPREGKYAQLSPLESGPGLIPSPGSSSAGAGIDFAKIVARYIERYAAIDARLISAERVGVETLATRNGNIACDLVRAGFRPPPGMREGRIERTLWISQDSGLILKERSDASMLHPASGNPVSVNQNIVFQTARADQPLGEELFSFSPPPGAVQVESFRRPGGAQGPIDRVAPPFALKDLSGSTVELSSLRGHVVLLDFWATWCGPCRYDMPHVEALYQEFADQGLRVFGINSEEPEQARAYLENHGLTFPTLHDGAAGAASAYGVRAIPTFVVIDRSGKVSSYMLGTRTREELRRALIEAGLRQP